MVPTTECLVAAPVPMAYECQAMLPLQPDRRLGLYGQSSSTGGAGLSGNAVATFGFTYDVFGKCQHERGRCVWIPLRYCGSPTLGTKLSKPWVGE